jgi:hypothetical protein
MWNAVVPGEISWSGVEGCMVVLGGMCTRVRVLLHGMSYLWFRDIVLVLFLFLLHELFVLDDPFI